MLLGESSVAVLGMVLAGGRGDALHPLTAHRALSAIPFGAKYRIIDFVLNNFVNSGLYSIYVLTQFKAQTLTEHIQRYWRFGAFLGNHFIGLAPAQMSRFEELGPVWYRGTADAVYQNFDLIKSHSPRAVVVFGGDHIFKMNVAHMVAVHAEHDADLTIAAYPMKLEECSRFGVLEVDGDHRLTGFSEKPARAAPISARPDHALVSMGNYVFRTEALTELLEHDASDAGSNHDFGRDVIPRALAEGLRVQVYDFLSNPLPGQEGPNTYWRDVGTLDAYYGASMDLVSSEPELDLYNPDWPLRTANTFSPPARFIHQGMAVDSLVGSGVVVSGAAVRESVLFRRSRVERGARVERSVLLEDVEVGAGAEVRRAILDSRVVVPPGARIGFDQDEDRARGLTVTRGGITVVTR